MRGQFAIEAHRSDSRNCRDFAPRRVGELRNATALPPKRNAVPKAGDVKKEPNLI